MWSMIRTNHRDTSIGERPLQSLTITFGFDGGVTLDARTQIGIVAITEIEMADGSLGGDERWINKFQFASRGEVGDVEAGMMLTCQFHRQTGTLITGLLATDFRMMNHLGVVTIQLLGLSHIAVDDCRILAMCHNGQLY